MSIESFSGNYHWLSNFHQARVQYDGVWYPTVENAYQAAKTFPDQRAQFKHCTPAMAKVYGREKPLMWANWDGVKLNIMAGLLGQKFRNGTMLAALLVQTGTEELIEGNDWGDTYWGKVNGKGENALGSLLMQIRDELHLYRPLTKADQRLSEAVKEVLDGHPVGLELLHAYNWWTNSFRSTEDRGGQ